MADFFVSYTSSDRDWAQWIGKQLEALGHVPHVHEWEIEGGGDIYDWMEKRLETADHVLCVVSEEYLKAPYSGLERKAALWQAASSRPGFVLFVVVKPARMPVLSDHIKRCELFGVNDATARARFRAFLEKREVPETVSFPGEAYTVSNIPLRLPPQFMGRDEALAAVDAAFERAADGFAVAALFGLRGVGKTTVAAAYAERHRSEFRATWWIRAQNEPGMRADLVALGVRLQWVGAEDKEDAAVDAVLERLQHEGDKILLIFDNAPDADAIKPYLPRGGQGKILVTSNAYAWRDVGTPVKIGIWSKEVGADYLIARTGRSSERTVAQTLSQALGGLPLAHEQAAAYCERLEKSLAGYLKSFIAAPARMLGDVRDAPTQYHERLTVTKTFALAIDEAAKLNAAVESLIVHAALLAAEPLPLYLFADGAAKLGEPLRTALADDGLDEALATLRSFALIERETIVDERDAEIETETIRLHRLVREVAAERCTGLARDAIRAALIEAMAAVYPLEMSDAETWAQGWPRARRLDAPALALCEAPLPEAAEETAARLIEALAAYRHHALGAYAAARPLYERALALREKRLGAEHQDTAETLNNLALLLGDEGNYQAARPLFERALAIMEKVHGPEHRATVTVLNNLALLLREQGDLGAARPLFERALATAEKTLGASHPVTAAALANLGLVKRGEGDLAAARVLFERALAIDQKALGAEHPDTANDLHLLGALRQQEADLAGARTFFEQALTIEEKALGPEHPRTAGTLRTLAELLYDMGDLTLARPYYERALAVSEKTAGADHPATAAALNNLANLLQDLGDFAGARPLLERALAIDEKALGPANANTNRLRYNLAKALLSTEQSEESLKLAQAALAAHESALGHSDRWTVDSAGLAARALDALGRGSEAQELRQRFELPK